MDLRIGIENELFLKGPDDPGPFPLEKEVKLYAENKLVPFYNEKRGRDLLRSGFVDHSHPGHKKDHTDNDKWAVTTDVTMVEFDLSQDDQNDQNDQDVEGCTYSRTLRHRYHHHLPNRYTGAFEFVSPILSFCPDSAWKEEVKTHWATLLEIGRVNVNNSCATHVHISRKAKSGPKKELDWTTEELRRVAQAVLYFDKAFDAILAPSRRGDFKTRSNRANNKKLGNRGFGECCKLIQNADLDHLVSLMQPKDSVQSDNISWDRFYRWNFENTKKGDVDGNIDGKRRIGTIGMSFGPKP